jgi:hypothetical protein
VGSATSTGTTGGVSTPSIGGATAGTVQPGAATGATGGAGNGLPCDVSAILKQKCQLCHGDPLVSGPMKLLTWADLQAGSTAMPGNKVAARVKARIADSKLPMPPTGRSPLTAEEKQILTAYIDGGAKQSQTTCATTSSDTGKVNTLPPDSECDYIQELRAHGGQTAGDTTPFEAPNGADHYEMFYYTPKWNEKVHVIRVDPIRSSQSTIRAARSSPSPAT